MKRYNSAIPAAQERQPSAIVDLALAAVVAALLLAFLGWAVSWLILGWVWPDAGALGLAPLVVLVVRLMAYLLGLPRETSGDETVRLIPVRSRQIVDDTDSRDLAFFVREVAKTGVFTQKAWRGRKLPSGASCSDEMYNQMISVMEKATFIVDRGPRSAGRLTTTDADAMLSRLGLD